MLLKEGMKLFITRMAPNIVRLDSQEYSFFPFFLVMTMNLSLSMYTPSLFIYLHILELLLGLIHFTDLTFHIIEPDS